MRTPRPHAGADMPAPVPSDRDAIAADGPAPTASAGTSGGTDFSADASADTCDSAVASRR